MVAVAIYSAGPRTGCGLNSSCAQNRAIELPFPFAVKWCTVTQAGAARAAFDACATPDCLVIRKPHQRPALSRGEAFQAVARAGERRAKFWPRPGGCRRCTRAQPRPLTYSA